MDYYLRPEKRTTKKWWLISLSAYLLLLGVIILLSSWLWREIKGNAAQNGRVTSAGRQKEARRLIPIKLFFVDATGYQLVPEIRSLPQTLPTVDMVKTSLTELFKGPQKMGVLSTIPRQTQLRELYLNGNGCAYVDLSPEVTTNHAGSIIAELATIYSIVNTLVVNFDEIESVRLLIAGKEAETLAGHIVLTSPFTANIKLVSNVAASSTETSSRSL